MKTIKVSETTYRALTDVASLPFPSTGERPADGDRLIQIEDDTYEQIRKERLPGETDDQVIQRLVDLIGRIVRSAQ